MVVNHMGFLMKGKKMQSLRTFFREKILRPFKRRRYLKNLKDNENAIQRIWSYTDPAYDHSIEDILLVYNPVEDKYYLIFDLYRDFHHSYSDVAMYLFNILGKFTGFMAAKKYDTRAEVNIYNIDMSFSADTIEELYAKFKIFVTGFLSTYV